MEIAADMTLSQFDLLQTPCFNLTRNFRGGRASLVTPLGYLIAYHHFKWLKSDRFILQCTCIKNELDVDLYIYLYFLVLFISIVSKALYTCLLVACTGCSEPLGAGGALLPAAPHGLLPHQRLRAVLPPRRPLLGLLLDQPRGNLGPHRPR